VKPTQPSHTFPATRIGLASIARAVAAFEPLILVIAAPALLFPRAGWTPVMLVIPLTWLARRIGRGRVVRRTPLDWAILLMLVMVLVSLYATFDVTLSLPKIAGMVLGVAIFYAVVEYADSPRRLWVAVGAFLFAGLGLAVVGLIGVNWSSKLPLLAPLTDRLPRLIRGLPGAQAGFSPNETAGALEWFVPLAWALTVWMIRRPIEGLQKAYKWAGLAPGLVAIVTTITMILTQSRGGLIGLMVGLLLLLFMAGRAGRLMVWGMTVAAIVVIVWLGPVSVWGTVTNEGTTLTTVSGRVEVWSRALYGIQDFPFTGMGMNAFRRVVPVLYPLFLISPEEDISHAHNHLLQAALDLGIPGLIAYLAMWLLAATMAVQTWRSRAPSIQRVLALGASAGLLAHFVYGMTDVVALGAKPGVFWWWLLALLTANWWLRQSS
jgi:putative inorganic carbon (hco3(-)) transporter